MGYLDFNWAVGPGRTAIFVPHLAQSVHTADGTEMLGPALTFFMSWEGVVGCVEKRRDKKL